MEYLKPFVLLFALFLLTSLLCWVSYDLFLLSPLFSVGFFLVGVLAVIMTVDAIKSVLYP
ncbi:hypothetical protein K9N68_26810 [Kovacikia minuta CCNUW1]|uniref:hypothetical protein n=1 Tax=Kovacikia minuta TaxID=2931930 RepID=UPI001CCCD1AD|nr:hypothetical protein [Kovacikia minuta]UBF25198.1 hypothetical protein K9N68_26810 [Kovacikia minuta CCNUW1]